MLRLMSHNIWNRDENSPEWEREGNDCSAQARAPGLLRVYDETEPDIVGVQEGSALMIDLLMRGFEMRGGKYSVLWGRFTPIIYRHDKLELVDSRFTTYPEIIEKYPGSFNDAMSKSFNLAVFRIKESGRLFVFATTHLWWKQSPTGTLFSAGSCFQEYSDEAREHQLGSLIEMALEYGKRYDCPIVIVGDMNTDYNSLAIQSAMRRGFAHAHNIATDYSEESVGYHNCFPWGFETEYFDRPFETAIDHILLFGIRDGAVKRFMRYSPDYYFPISDHSPAYIDIEI